MFIEIVGLIWVLSVAISMYYAGVIAFGRVAGYIKDKG